MDSSIAANGKRYRYTGKERDEETGLYYHGARYYACWLGRWTASDPIGISGGINLYEYAASSPAVLSDPTGNAPADAELLRLRDEATTTKEKAIAESLKVVHAANAAVAEATKAAHESPTDLNLAVVEHKRIALEAATANFRYANNHGFEYGDKLAPIRALRLSAAEDRALDATAEASDFNPELFEMKAEKDAAVEIATGGAEEFTGYGDIPLWQGSCRLNRVAA